MLKNFRQDPRYLIKYHLKWGFSLLVLNLALAFLSPVKVFDFLVFAPFFLFLVTANLRLILGTFLILSGYCLFRSDFQILNLLSVLPVAAFSLTFSALIHCASHDSIKPAKLNRFLGELMGVIQLSSLPEWKIVHTFHHKFADHPELDPHPPLQKSYWEFATDMRTSIGMAFQKLYFQYFEKNEASIQNLKMIGLTSRFDNLMKVVFWFLLLKPQLFVIGFVFSVVFKMLHFAWFNYSTHRPVEENKSEVKIHNLTQSLYAVMNFFSFGLYYHDNHHKAPYLFNPKYMEETEAKPQKAAGL